MEVAAVTAIAYLIIALLIDLVPGLHVGGGDRAMPKVAAICNLIAGIVGGGFAFRALSQRAKPGNYLEDPAVIPSTKSSKK